MLLKYLDYIARIVGYIAIFFILLLVILLIYLYLKEKYNNKWKWRKEQEGREQQKAIPKEATPEGVNVEVSIK